MPQHQLDLIFEDSAIQMQAQANKDINTETLGLEWITLWLFNIAMGNDPFIVCLPIKHGDSQWEQWGHIKISDKPKRGIYISNNTLMD